MMRKMGRARREQSGLSRTPPQRSFRRGLHPIPPYFIIDLTMEWIIVHSVDGLAARDSHQ